MDIQDGADRLLHDCDRRAMRWESSTSAMVEATQNRVDDKPDYSEIHTEDCTTS